MLQGIFDNTKVKDLGERKFKSPIPLSYRDDDLVADFVRDDEKVIFNASKTFIKNFIDDLDNIPALRIHGCFPELVRVHFA